MTQATNPHLGESLGTDIFSVREQFIDEQWSRFIAVRRFVDEEVVPVIGPYWERAEIPWKLVQRLPELGIVGEDIQGYGCAGWAVGGARGLSCLAVSAVKPCWRARLSGARLSHWA